VAFSWTAGPPPIGTLWSPRVPEPSQARKTARAESGAMARSALPGQASSPVPSGTGAALPSIGAL
jgi:hypothetical protein